MLRYILKTMPSVHALISGGRPPYQLASLANSTLATMFIDFVPAASLLLSRRICMGTCSQPKLIQNQQVREFSKGAPIPPAPPPTAAPSPHLRIAGENP